MFKRMVMIGAIALLSPLVGNVAQAQFGGVQVQVGGYGTGVRVGGFGYGNGFYNNYGNNFGNGYQNRYGNYRQMNGFYLNNGYNSSYGNVYGYPNAGYRYSTPRYYSAPVRRYSSRRFR